MTTFRLHQRLLLLLLLFALLPSKLPARSYELDFKQWSDEKLLDRAIRSYHDGDCGWALKAYRALLGRSLSADTRASALYNQGICFEMGQFWDEAAESYAELVEVDRDSEIALDAQFRLGVMHELRGQSAEAARAFRALRRRYSDMKRRDQRAVEIQLAWQEFQLGKSARAIRRIKAVQAQWEAEAKDELAREAFYRGKAHVILGRILSREAEKLDFAPFSRPAFLACTVARMGFASKTCALKRLEAYEGYLRAAEYQYARALRLRSPIWNSASLFLLGITYENYYVILNCAPIPKELSKRQKVLYEQLMREKTRRHLLRASQLYHRGHELALESGDDSGWAEALRRKVQLIEEKGVDGLGQEPEPDLSGDLGGRWLR